MNAASFMEYITQLSINALKHFNRQIVVLQGSEKWANALLMQVKSATLKKNSLNQKIAQQVDANNSTKKWLIYRDNSGNTHTDKQKTNDENICEKLSGNVDKQTYKYVLGSESDFVVFYQDELNSDALAALSGTLVAGGLLFIVLPTDVTSSAFKQSQPSQFIQRLVTKLLNDPAVHFIKQGSASIVEQKKEMDKEVNHAANEKLNTSSVTNTYQLNRLNVLDTSSAKNLELNCLTQEQLIAVKEIKKVAQGRRDRPLILTADRGRGKSSALAIACADLLQNSSSEINIAVTASHRQSLTVFFKQLQTSLASYSSPDLQYNVQEQLKDHENKKIRESSELAIKQTRNYDDQLLQPDLIVYKNSCVKFIPLHELSRHKTVFNLVIIDEAASTSLNVLNKLLTQYHRLVFATTVHGYEGAGRSFTLKFTKHVARTYPNSKTLTINQPMRWAENDPVELFINDLCLLNTQLPTLSVELTHALLKKKLNHLMFDFEVVSVEQLRSNEVLLQQVFAVLITAHYQTSPNDLQLLLDNAKVTLVTLSYKKELVGVALLLNEGCINNTDAEHNKAQLISLIQTNQRRLKNQFIPQSLLSHCGQEKSFDYSYLRIMRIAIVPELQNQGVGGIFLAYIEQHAQQHSIDFIGTSFGVNQPLLKFWQQHAYKIARIGFTKDKASGEHSALMLKPVNYSLQSLHIFQKNTPQKNTLQESFIDNIEQAFYQSFDYLLAEQYNALDAKLVWQIMNYCPTAYLPVMQVVDCKAVEDFYTTKRQYSVCVYHLHKWLQHQMQKPFNKKMAPAINKIFQRKDIASISQLYGYTGKKAFNTALIDFVQEYSQLKS